MELNQGSVVLCEFYFSTFQKTKKRPVLIFKQNLPYDDFLVFPISSKIAKLQDDEILLESNKIKSGSLPKDSKVILRKPFAINKKIIEKKYGDVSQEFLEAIHVKFCRYFACGA